MNRGRASVGRARWVARRMEEGGSLPLLRGVDHGEPVVVPAAATGQTGDRWIGPFLEANAGQLARLGLRPEVRTRSGVDLVLHPGSHIGAIPLLAPSTRRVTAGLLVEPRFRWTSLGAVLQQVGFKVEPSLGGSRSVPGSAREVPPWILAAPVLRRLQALLEHERRGFVEHREVRASPRGRIDWTDWASHHVTSGRWGSFPCSFPDPKFDPSLRAQMRWTLRRLRDSLFSVADSQIGRALLDRASEMILRVGEGPDARPSGEAGGLLGAFMAEAQEAMAWVAEERGLGGARALDGLAWDLDVDQVWETWVAWFAGQLAPRLGLSARVAPRQTLDWKGSVRSMSALVPDTVLQGRDRTVLIDAKYKAHLSLLAARGWDSLSAHVREAHRADLHQVLAYAALGRTDDVDAILVYPDLGGSLHPPRAVASVPAGRRRVRLILAALPFGFSGPDSEQRVLGEWREALSEA
jgi:McrBC 5-methylcytosine restriction system component